MNVVYIDCSKEEALRVWNEWKANNRDAYLSVLSSYCYCGNHARHVHHIDGDKRNNFGMNHQALCGPCHRKIHKELQVSYLFE